MFIHFLLREPLKQPDEIREYDFKEMNEKLFSSLIESPNNTKKRYNQNLLI